MRVAVSVLAATLAMVMPSPARAAEPVMIAPATSEGATPAIEATLQGRLVEVVGRGELEIVDASDALGRRAAECGDDECRAAVIREAGATFLLVPDINLDDEDYRLGVTLYGPGGAKSARLEENCALCGLAEAADVMADLGARIGRKVEVATRASLVEVRSEPTGAKVFLGDELIGTTPFEFPMAPGSYELRIELGGYIAQRRTVEVAAGESKQIELDLQPVPVEAGAEKDRSRVFLGVGVTALVAGLGAGAGGGALIALDEKPIKSECSGGDVDINGNCRWRHSTLEAGIGLVVGGVALVGTGIALVIVGRKRARSGHAARLSPVLGGLGVRF